MLKIYIGSRDESIYDPSTYFDNTFEKEWLFDEDVKRMIKDIDNSEVGDDGSIHCPIFGTIPPRDLSGGVKTLILLKFDKTEIFDISACGGNCASWIEELGNREDIEVDLGYLMPFKVKYPILLLNPDKIVKSYDDYLFEYIERDA